MVTNLTRNPIYKFSELSVARGFADRATKTMMIVLGDDARFWVVFPADGERLIKAGYEYAH
jgi:hypothetical protein